MFIVNSVFTFKKTCHKCVNVVQFTLILKIEYGNDKLMERIFSKPNIVIK